MTEPATASQVVPPWQGPKRQAEILPVTSTMVTEYPPGLLTLAPSVGRATSRTPTGSIIIIGPTIRTCGSGRFARLPSVASPLLTT